MLVLTAAATASYKYQLLIAMLAVADQHSDNSALLPAAVPPLGV
jgi:hypothetical protein